MKIPNLFDYATSELSQDAFILWLLQWANPNVAESDQRLHEISQNFVQLLLGDDKLEISSIESDKQKFHIDVFAIVNNKYFILIEDKTHSTHHHNQMTTYSKEIECHNEYHHLQKHCIYLKTGNESQEDIEAIRKNYETNNANWHFTTIQRRQFLDVLNNYDGENHILHNFRDHLAKLENDTMSYKYLPVDEWSWSAWQGFYTELAMHKPNIWWGTVPAKSGAFVCAAWYRQVMVNGCILKLQIEGHHKAKSRMCIKIEMTTIEQKYRWTTLREFGTQIIKLSNMWHLELGRPSRYSSKGKVLTLACTDIKNIIKGVFDIGEILNVLSQYEGLISEFIAIKNKIL